jgi:hypothetical protein
MYALSLAASLLSSAGAGSLLEDGGRVAFGVGVDAGAGVVVGRREVDEEWLGTDDSAREWGAVPAVVCWVGRSGCGGSAGIFSE